MSNQPSFTKGPWAMCHRGESLKGAAGRDVVIWGCGLTNRFRTDEAVANSALIAEAPELYRMLSDFKDFAVRQGWHHVLINDAEKLLSKIRGE